MKLSRQPINCLLSLVIILVSVVANAAVAQDTNLLEEFVRSPDREIVLKKLVPGTQEYYFLHSLHYSCTRCTTKTRSSWTKLTKRWPHGKSVLAIGRRNGIRSSIAKCCSSTPTTLRRRWII